MHDLELQVKLSLRDSWCQLVCNFSEQTLQIFTGISKNDIVSAMLLALLCPLLSCPPPYACGNQILTSIPQVFLAQEIHLV